MHRHLSKFKNKKTLIAVLACLGIVLTTVGVTVAWFTYSRNGQKENSISSGKITFIYQENEEVGNGILLSDAMPMPDSYGKTQENKFDFKVTSTTGVAKIPYEITLRKTDNSDDIGNSVKVYLTKVDGTNEEQKVLSMYSNLANSTNAIAMVNGEKTLYKTEIPAGSENYTDNYRLRIWLNDNPSDGNVLSYQQTVTQECSDTNYTTKETCEGAGEKWLDKATPAAAKNFTIKVNVYAEGEAATQEEIAGAESTSIRNISIGNTNATENTDTAKNYDYEITTTSSNVEINVETSNANATASVTSYNPTAMNSKVRRISTSSIQPLTNGDNYFKITVTSANKQKTKDYILKVTKELSHDAKLSSLSIADCPLNEQFDPDVLSYTCTTEVASINPVYTLSYINGTNVTIDGNENLVIGNNNMTITVTAADGTTTMTYIIDVERTAVSVPLSTAIFEKYPPASVGQNPDLNGTVVSGLYKADVTNGFGGSPGTTYYFRGNVDNNYVNFAGKTWRIVRINEDGTFRLAMNQGINSGIWYTYQDGENTLNYMYYTYKNSTSATTAMTRLNNWYTSNIDQIAKGTKKYSDYVATGNYFCEQAKVAYNSTYANNSGAGGMTAWNSYTPNWNCTSVAGHGLVNTNIGLLTYDEIVFAGNQYGKNNTNYYLYHNYIWFTMSPCGFTGSTATIWTINSDSSFKDTGTASGKEAPQLIPVINLNNDVLVAGSGTSADPWTVSYR